MDSLWVAKTGLEAQQTRMAVVAQNLSNVNTTGYKRGRAIFEDLLYQNVVQAGGLTSQQTEAPTGLNLGTGVRVVATDKQFTQGNLITTNNSFDVAIQGRGFFEILLPAVQCHRVVTNQQLAPVGDGAHVQRLVLRAQFFILYLELSQQGRADVATTQQDHVHPHGNEPCRQRGLQHVARQAGILSDHHVVSMLAARELGASRLRHAHDSLRIDRRDVRRRCTRSSVQ